MADLAFILNNMSDVLKASKIHIDPDKPFKQGLFIRGKLKNYRYSISYCFKKSQYCIVFAPINSRGKIGQHISSLNFPSGVVEFVNQLKVNGE